MIDTDKYEGHTPAPWTILTIDTMRQYPDSPCLKLAQDAPLLLEEVKRLRHELLLILSDFQTRKTDMYEMRNRIETILKGVDEE